MERVAYTTFRTAIGHCGLAWNDAGLVAVQLPERSAAATAARLRSRFPGARRRLATRPVRQARAAIVRLLAGGRDHLSAIHLDLSGCSPFFRKVYEITRTIPPGETLSYGELAALAGNPHAARAVGQAMARNPFPLLVPCHRVLAAGGGAGGFSAPGGVGTKFRLLRIEGALPQRELPLGR
jgi:methylated-DNA-[protein]-cysteine S-methyltransferase